MNTSDLLFLSLPELARLLAAKKISPVELTEAALGRIERLNPRLNAFITVTAEQAQEQARQAEREIARKKRRGPLHGIPISLKDNIATRGIRTTAGAKVLAEHVPMQDATVVERLRRAGAVIVGKTNLHEFAYGVTTNNAHFGPTRNPWETERIPGGSSGGSAAAIAAGMCCASIGTDTGGSIRIPAALCGLVGLKPTFGRVSCTGVVPLARSLDHVGPLARTALDAALVLEAIAGYDPHDATTIRASLPEMGRLKKRRLRSLRLGWPQNYFFEQLDDEVAAAMERVRKLFEKKGARIVEISLPLVEHSSEPSGYIAYAEALQAHQQAGWYPARRSEYSEELRKRLEAGIDVRATDYLAALEFQRAAHAEFETAFQDVDAILAPTTPIPAPRIGEERVKLGGKEETVRAALIRLNRPANLTGHPAISLPCGFTKAGLPLGLQIIGRAFDEAGIVQVAAAYEMENRWQERRPKGI